MSCPRTQRCEAGRLEPGALRSRVKHSTTEPLRYLISGLFVLIDLILYVPSTIIFSYIGAGLPGLNQY